MRDSELIKEEYNSKRLEREKYILVVLFLIQQRWNYIIGRSLAADNITTKQWLMMIIMVKAFESPPSMQEVANALSTTHQNVKQLATRLEDRGFLKIKQDPDNRRILRLKVTEECHNFWEKRGPQDIKEITSLFTGLDDEEIKDLFEIMNKLEKISAKLYENSKK
ncbi:MAG: MarR family transcriptional regulator, negative regulator of the multidrug operon emrRAB [Methanobacterium sp.]|jgi:DNA-binding MarR family transcriptional regulator|uniref:MarR family winged helix-turn-helix transcriptional regulator n=1 Tax=Methanobacterium sp. TaxID=2164 RepID=UPI0003C99751|nr:MarR family transcriptional regulator [Methanobacterium sp.]MDI3549176.1 MarR family transcriptional regulator, negative regulator of the multidrug operon emrRAB [Methanobacterium sp.]CDG64376.1 regulatory protein MarR [Methanobacterium sp. MB1]